MKTTAKLSVLLLSVALAACSGNKIKESDDFGDSVDGSDIYQSQNDTAHQSADSTTSSGTYNSSGYRDPNVYRDSSSDTYSSTATNNTGAITLQHVFYFNFDQSLLTAEARAALDAHVAYLQYENGMIRLEGHADERGTREYNMALGERRAKAVANYLISRGIPSNRIETISYGEERPQAYGSTEEAMRQNRRVELK